MVSCNLSFDFTLAEKLNVKDDELWVEADQRQKKPAICSIEL